MTEEAEDFSKDPQVREAAEALKRLEEELGRESDRGAVLVAAAMFEEELKDLILTMLVPNPGGTDPLFDGPTAPAQSFAAKIDIAFRLGVISDRFCRDAHIIRRIRNTVAHRAAGCTFADAGIADRIKALTNSHGIFVRSADWVAAQSEWNARRQFIETISWMLFAIRMEIDRVKRLEVRRVEFGYRVVMDGPKKDVPGGKGPGV